MNPTLEDMNAVAADFDIKDSELLTVEQEKQLISLLQSGDYKALAQFVECELRFVFMIAKHYQDRGADLPTLIGAGTKGLVIAAQQYDVNADFKFLSYAIWWIRNEIVKVINK